jgi:hypothetical protein
VSWDIDPAAVEIAILKSGQARSVRFPVARIESVDLAIHLIDQPARGRDRVEIGKDETLESEAVVHESPGAPQQPAKSAHRGRMFTNPLNPAEQARHNEGLSHPTSNSQVGAEEKMSLNLHGIGFPVSRLKEGDRFPIEDGENRPRRAKR